MPIPFTVLPSSLRGGPKLAEAPKPGITVKSPPATPDFDGTPSSFVNLPAPLYIPQVVIRVTVAYTVAALTIRWPVVGFIPLLASIAPNLARDSTSTSMEHYLK